MDQVRQEVLKNFRICLKRASEAGICLGNLKTPAFFSHSQGV